MFFFVFCQQDLSSELHSLKDDHAQNKSALQSALALASEERESSRMREEDNEIRYLFVIFAYTKCYSQ